MKRIALLLVMSCFAAAACSSGTGSSDGGAGASGTAGTGGAGGGGASGTAGTGGAGGGGASGTAGTGGAGGGAGNTGTGGGTGGVGGRGGAGGVGGIGGGGGTAGGGGTTGTGGRGGTGGANSTCASAIANAACTTEGTTCGSCTDACQFCNLLRCVSGHWQNMEAAPAPCFSCGPSLRCQTYAQYCDATLGGAVGATGSYRCTALPAACTTTRTCACLQSQNVPGSCVQAGTGELTVTLLAPGPAPGDAGAPFTQCPASRPTVGATCTGMFTCNYNDTCNDAGCCYSGYGCSGGSITFLGTNDGCLQGH